MANEFVVKNGLISSGSVRVSGSITAQSFTGSFSGSIANAISASYASTASVLLNNYLNAVDFGLSTTSNDNGPFLNAAFGASTPTINKSINIGGGRTIYIPPGTYKIATPVSISANLWCDKGAIFQVTKSLAGSFPRHAFMITSSKNIRVDNLYVDADLTDGTYSSSLFVDGLWISFITNFTTTIPPANSSSIGLYFKQGAYYGPNDDYGTYLVLVDNPTIVGGGGKYGIALEGNPSPASASFITAIHVNGGYIANQYSANIFVNKADYCTFEKIATDVVRTGSYAYFVTRSNNIEIEAGEYNPIAASGGFPSNYFLGTGPLPTNATGSGGNPTVYLKSPDILLNGLESASWAGTTRSSLKISPINGSPYFYTQVDSGFAAIYSVKGRMAYNGAPNNFWSQQERDIFKCTTYAGISDINFTDTAFSSEPLIKYSGIGMELPWNSTERQRVYVSGALGVSNNLHVGVSSAGGVPEPTTFSNAANGQITIAYPSGSNPDQYGGMLTFRQAYNSANLTALVNVGAIVGTKTSANGSFGGGLTFLHQPALNTPMSASFGYNNDGKIGIGPITLSSITSRVQISGSASETLLTVGAPSAAATLVVTGSGRVGIGTATPSATLNVNGTTTLQGGQTTIQGSGTTSATTALRVQNSSATARLTILDNGTTAFNTSQLYISSSGVSIFNSTTAPFLTASILDIANSNTASILSISNRTARGISGSSGELRFYRGVDYGGGNNELASPIASISAFDPTSGSGDIFRGRLLFSTQFNSATPVLAMTIDENQYVGIGTSSPSFRLDVSGSTRIIGNLTITGSTISNSGFTGSLQGTASFAVSASSVDSASFAISSSRAVTSSFALTASFVPNIFNQGGNSFGTTATLGTNDIQNLELETNGSTRLFISSSGASIFNSTTSPFVTASILDIANSNTASILSISNRTARGESGSAGELRFYRGVDYGGGNNELASPIANITAFDPTSGSSDVFRGRLLFGTQFNSAVPILAMTIDENQYVGIGTSTPSARLNVNGATLLQGGQTTVRGAGATSATTAFRVENANASASITTLDNGATTLIPSANTTPLTITAYSLTGSNIQPALDISGSWNTSGFVNLINANITNVASAANSRLIHLSVNGTTQFSCTTGGNLRAASTDFAPSFNADSFSSTNASVFVTSGTFTRSSGTNTFTGASLSPTINQTGGANGITRGLYVNPALTSAASWRSIEWSNNTGFGLYGIGGATNYLSGSLGIGTTTPSSSLHISGASAILTLSPISPLPTTGIPSASFATSGSGVDLKPYFWNGATWTALF